MILKVKRHNVVEFFNNFTLSMKYDSVGSSFSFVFYFDPENSEHERLFQPGHNHQVDVEHNGELLLRGFMLNHGFSNASQKGLTSVSGYSLCGVLEDSSIPVELYPLQSNDKTLREIANHLISKFNFSLVVDSSVAARVDTRYDISTAAEGQSMKSYLSELCSQRDVIMSHTPEGNLLMTQAKTRQTPIYHFEGDVVGTSMGLSVKGQKMHSHITVMKQASITGGNAGEVTIRNPFVPFTYRPLVKTQTSGDDTDTAEAARNILAKELKNIVLTITTKTWEIDGKVIKPNSIITVRNPELYLYNTNKWFVESVALTGNESETTAVLTCVRPEVYNKDTPEYIFIDDHSHA